MKALWRRFVRRSARPAGMLAVVGILSLSMVGAQPAYAADTMMDTKRDLKAFEAIIKANYKTISPVANIAMKAGSFTPVGRLLSLGMLAYSTSDMWMPLIAGGFGAPTQNTKTTAPAGTANIDPLWELDSASASWGLVKITGRVTAQGAMTTDTNIGFSYRLRCNSKNDGTGTWYADKTGFSTTTYNKSNSPRTIELNPSCTSGYPISVIAGATGADPLLTAGSSAKGPTTVVRFGEFVTTSGGFNPYGENVKYKVRSECIAPDGTLSTIEAESSGDYLQVPACGAAGKGHGTGKTSVVGLAPGTTTETPIWDTPRAPSDPATPLCDASRPTDGCTLSVELDGKTCDAGNVECQNWAEVNQADPNKNTDASRMKCRLGPYKVAMSACNALEKAYVGGQIWSDENTDGDPATGGAPKTAPSGSPIAAPAPTTTAPGVGTVPGVGGQPGAESTPEQRQCFPTGWAMFNPVEWVMKPVGCALTAAFVPKPETVHAQQTRIQTKLAGVGFAPLSAAWLATYESAGGGSGCAGPTIRFSMNGVEQTLQPFQACTQPMATVAGVANAVCSLALVLFGGLGMVRAVGSALGFNFTLGKGDSE